MTMEQLQAECLKRQPGISLWLRLVSKFPPSLRSCVFKLDGWFVKCHAGFDSHDGNTNFLITGPQPITARLGQCGPDGDPHSAPRSMAHGTMAKPPTTLDPIHVPVAASNTQCEPPPLLSPIAVARPHYFKNARWPGRPPPPPPAPKQPPNRAGRSEMRNEAFNFHPKTTDDNHPFRHLDKRNSSVHPYSFIRWVAARRMVSDPLPLLLWRHPPALHHADR